MEKETFSVGRVNCDVPTGSRDPHVSRMQCWVFNLPCAIILVDGWSLYGTWVVNRGESTDELPRSVPHERRAFIIPHGEPVLLCLGGDTDMTINPRLCVICCDKPRTVRLPCGHQGFCSSCIRARGGVLECPLCRASTAVDAAKFTDEAMSQPTCVSSF